MCRDILAHGECDVDEATLSGALKIARCSCLYTAGVSQGTNASETNEVENFFQWNERHISFALLLLFVSTVPMYCPLLCVSLLAS